MRKAVAAPLRQNLKSIDQFIPPAWARARLCAFGRHAFFAATIAALALTLAFACADPPSAEEQAPAVLSLDFDQQNGRLEIDWSGLIVPGVADELRASVAKYGTALKRVVLFLDSAGGRVDEGDRVIAVLNEIKQRHRLATVVPHGKLVYTDLPPRGRSVCGAGESLDLPRGVTAAGEWRHWLKSIAPLIKGADLWQTGGDLIDAKTGIIMYALGDTIERPRHSPRSSRNKHPIARPW